MVKDDFSGAENRSFGAKTFRSQKFSIGAKKRQAGPKGPAQERRNWGVWGFS